MDEKMYLELGETLSQLTETCLLGRFGETCRVVVPCPGSKPTATFPLQEPAKESTRRTDMSVLPWYWVYYPYLDAPEKQQESALHAGYIKVVGRDDADKVIAEKDEEISALKHVINMADAEYFKLQHSIDGCRQEIAEKDKVIAKLERQIEFLKVTHDACGNCNKCADGMGKVFDKYIKEQP